MSQNRDTGIRSDIVKLIPALRAFALRFYPNRNDADDLVQDTLLKALTSIHTFQSDTNLRNWTFTIMRNTHANRHHRDKRMVVGLDNLDHLMPMIRAPQEWAIRAKEFDRAVNDLPESFRDAYKRVLCDGDAYETVAAACHLPVGTVKSRVSRAKSFLANHLGDTVATAASI